MPSYRTSLLIVGALALGAALWYTFRSVPAQHAVHMGPTAQVVTTVPTQPATNATTPLASTPATNTPQPKAKALTPVQCPANIPAQRFVVQAARDTVLRSAGGCTVQVPAHAFVDAAGRPIAGFVTVELKEVLKPVDFVLGNMATLYKGKPLESAGSFSITASADGHDLALADGHALNMAVPTSGRKANMKLFPGEESGGSVEWGLPAALEAPAMARIDGEVAQVAVMAFEQVVSARTNLMYRVERAGKPCFPPPQVVADRIGEIAYADSGLWLQRDSTFKYKGYDVLLYATDSITGQAQAWNPTGTTAPVAGVNTFSEDPAMNYVFKVKRLGWANIDRLMVDKRTRPVDLVTRVDNGDGKEQVLISMVVKSHGIYIPGYRRKDGTYGFSHSDLEQMQLPVGAKATIIATAQREGEPWYALQEITIAEHAEVDLRLQHTTAKGLRQALLSAL
ncbi:MAG TPA: hypothetical protein VHL57_11330 [Flavobacteriales bacterium]|jgi:hypothetical protein|nr:hypothetical protein [Flavobacteriales bacterium]